MGHVLFILFISLLSLFYAFSRHPLLSLVVYHTLVFCSECAKLVNCFAGNQDLPLLRLFLIASLILLSEILLTHCLYLDHRTLFIRCLLLSPVARGIEGSRGEKKFILNKST
jgi:hypothetical protein